MIKPTAHGRFLSFKDEDFCFLSFKDKNIPCAVPKDEDFYLSKTAFEIKHVEFRRQSLNDKVFVIGYRTRQIFYVLERPKGNIFIFER